MLGCKHFQPRPQLCEKWGRGGLNRVEFKGRGAPSEKGVAQSQAYWWVLNKERIQFLRFGACFLPTFSFEVRSRIWLVLSINLSVFGFCWVFSHQFRFGSEISKINRKKIEKFFEFLYLASSIEVTFSPYFLVAFSPNFLRNIPRFWYFSIRFLTTSIYSAGLLNMWKFSTASPRQKIENCCFTYTEFCGVVYFLLKITDSIKGSRVKVKTARDFWRR